MEIPKDTHGLVPGDTSLSNLRNRPVPQGGEPGTINPFTARFIGLAGPVAIAGWGYDIFGRPVPGAVNLAELNGVESSPKNYSQTKFITKNAGGAKFPLGGESLPTHHVAGMLDVRYDPRHGLWRTNHFFLAEITGVVSTGNSIFCNRYGWREIEIHEINLPDPTTKNMPVDTIDFPYPARSYVSGNEINNYAINLAESSANQHDRIHHKIPSGTIVQMRSINVLKADYGDDPSLNDYQPLYIFEQAGYNSVFIKILGYDGTYPGPLSEGDASPLGNEPNYNQAARMPTRWIYQGVIVQFSGGRDIPSDRRFSTPFGSFVEDETIPIQYRKVQCINLIEIGNPPGKRGLVCPGIVTATGNTITAANVWPDGVPGGIAFTGGTKSAYPKGFAVQPVCSGTIVEARRLPSPNGTSTYGPIYYFQVENAHDGGCASGVWPFYGHTTQSPMEYGSANTPRPGV
jgi:hypothetical protein